LEALGPDLGPKDLQVNVEHTLNVGHVYIFCVISSVHFCVFSVRYVRMNFYIFGNTVLVNWCTDCPYELYVFGSIRSSIGAHTKRRVPDVPKPKPTIQVT
jgi:hypothetical protein